MNFISSLAHFQLKNLPPYPSFRLKLPFVNGSFPAILNSYIEQKWWLPNDSDMENPYSIPLDSYNQSYSMDKSMNANSIDLTDSYRMMNSDNVLLMGNSNEVILPITYNSNWVSAKDSILWSYPLDSIDMVDDKLCIQEAVSGKKGYIVSFWYHKTNDWPFSYNGFAVGTYVNNRYWMRVQTYGRSYVSAQ
jgi:hypothetical protein